MSPKNRIFTNIAKVSGFFIKILRLGSGSTWPGHLILKLNKNYVKEVLQSSKTKVILIAGTNGKTTTSTLLRHILEKNGQKVFQNSEGANLLNGIASAIIKNTQNSNLNYDTAIFEVDENVLPNALEQTSPDAVILLNLFRDQLDRYGEVNIVADKWLESLKNIDSETILVVNGDDPQIKFLGDNTDAKVFRYGLSDKFFTKKSLPHDVDSVYCPSCGEKLIYSGLVFSHLGNYQCKNCGFKRENIEDFANLSIKYSLRGTYNIYNAHAAILTLHNLFHFPIKNVFSQMVDFKPAFGRQESFDYQGRKVVILLSKNPTGFNQSIEVANSLIKKEAGILLVLNDRIPDGRDVSWIWDVDLEGLKSIDNTVIAGDRVYDMALRLKYSRGKELSSQTYEDLSEALKHAIQNTPSGGTLVVLPTYSAMLEVRKLLLGRKFL